MKTEYEYNNKQYETAVHDLKSTFFDIFSLHQKNLQGMKEAIDITDGEKQVSLIRQYNRQKFQLNEMLGLVDSVIASIQDMDSCSQFLNIKDTKDQELQEEIDVDISKPNLVEQQLKSLENSLIPQQVSVDDIDLSNENSAVEAAEMNNFKPDSIMVESGADVRDNNIGEEKVVETVPTNPIEIEVKSAPVMDVNNIKPTFAAPNVPTIVGAAGENKEISAVNMDKNTVDKQSISDESMINSAVEEETFVADHNDLGVQKNVVVSHAPNEVTDTVSVDEVNDAASFIPQEVNLSQILSPIDDVLPTNVSDVSDKEGEVESGVDENKDLEQKEDEIQSLNEESQDNSVVVPVEIIQKFEKVSSGQVKAILVTDKQYNNLLNSKGNQKILFEGFANPSKKQENVVEEQESGVVVQQQEVIEKMLEQANLLYKEGKAEEAQEMYDKISDMNKQLQSQNQVSPGVSLVKK